MCFFKKLARQLKKKIFFLNLFIDKGVMMSYNPFC